MATHSMREQLCGSYKMITNNNAVLVLPQQDNWILCELWWKLCHCQLNLIDMTFTHMDTAAGEFLLNGWGKKRIKTDSVPKTETNNSAGLRKAEVRFWHVCR